MNKEISVLLAEDDPDLLFLLKDQLIEDGFIIHAADNGLDAYRLFLETRPDIVILDVDMPGINGIQLCMQIRKMDAQTPIIFTSGLSNTSDVRTGFDAGANDYLKKPYDIDELVIRIKHLLNPYKKADNSEDTIFRIGKFDFDSELHSLSSGTNVQGLSYTENSLLKLLAENVGKIVTREMMIDHVWETSPAIESRSMDVYISRLRRYLSDDQHITIINCYGKGYRLVVR
ncbi:MAG: response regulator transcription factor [Bacteroidales bacterium]|jgi:DNA-binding response OmpR family regulator|nr:response regulator transcription factor [Bacteroidales bacterium]